MSRDGDEQSSGVHALVPQQSELRKMKQHKQETKTPWSVEEEEKQETGFFEGQSRGNLEMGRGFCVKRDRDLKWLCKGQCERHWRL